MNYLLLIIVPTVLYAFEEVIPTKGNYFRKSGIIFIIIMTSLRYGFGADYFTYYDAFYRIQSGIFTDAFEPGYILLNKIIAFLGLHFNFVLFVIAVFNYTLLYLAIEDNIDKNKWISMFLFLIYFDLFFYSLSAVRQSIVISIFLYSSKYIITKKPIRYIAWLLFGSLFHWTSLALVPVYFIYEKLKSLTKKKAIFYVVLSIGLYELFMTVLPALRPFMSWRFEYYLFVHDSDIGSNYLAAILMMALTIVWIYISTRLKSTEVFIGGKIKSEDLNVITFPMFAIMMYFILQILQRIEYFSVLPRMQMYFYPFYIFAMPQALSIMKVRDRKVLILASIGIFTLFFLYRYHGINQYASQYYQSFRLIFSK